MIVNDGTDLDMISTWYLQRYPSTGHSDCHVYFCKTFTVDFYWLSLQFYCWWRLLLNVQATIKDQTVLCGVISIRMIWLSLHFSIWEIVYFCPINSLMLLSITSLSIKTTVFTSVKCFKKFSQLYLCISFTALLKYILKCWLVHVHNINR